MRAKSLPRKGLVLRTGAAIAFFATLVSVFEDSDSRVVWALGRMWMIFHGEYSVAECSHPAGGEGELCYIKGGSGASPGAMRCLNRRGLPARSIHSRCEMRHSAHPRGDGRKPTLQRDDRIRRGFATAQTWQLRGSHAEPCGRRCAAAAPHLRRKTSARLFGQWRLAVIRMQHRSRKTDCCCVRSHRESRTCRRSCF
jgi:hypothetical protein